MDTSMQSLYSYALVQISEDKHSKCATSSSKRVDLTQKMIVK